MQPRQSIADSPWFWVLIFSLMAILALVAIGGKYGRRQAKLEVKYQAGERIADARDARNNPDGEARTDEIAARRPFASPGDTLVPIWPLAAILCVVALFATVMLIRGQRLASVSDESSPQ